VDARKKPWSRAGGCVCNVDGNLEVAILDEENFFTGIWRGWGDSMPGLRVGLMMCNFKLVHGNGGVVGRHAHMAGRGRVWNE